MKSLSELNKKEFEEFVYDQIPITKDMDFKVEIFEENKIEIKASLEKNINHKSTAFGGSINSLMTMTAWSMVFKIIKEIDEKAHIVIQKSNIEYLLPIRKDFVASCKLEDQKKIDRFTKIYKRKGKSRIELEVEIEEENKICAKFIGSFVVFK